MRDALELVRRELGPSASVLHTREVNSGPLRRLVFGRKYEVAASATVNVPSRLPARLQEQGFETRRRGRLDAVFGVSDYRARMRSSRCGAAR